MEKRFDIIEWGRIKDKLKNQYSELTDADLVWGRVSRDDMLQMVSTKLGKTKKEMMEVINSF